MEIKTIQKKRKLEEYSFNPAIEGGALTLDEFKDMIRKAEQGRSIP